MGVRNGPSSAAGAVFLRGTGCLLQRALPWPTRQSPSRRSRSGRSVTVSHGRAPCSGALPWLTRAGRCFGGGSPERACQSQSARRVGDGERGAGGGGEGGAWKRCRQSRPVTVSHGQSRSRRRCPWAASVTAQAVGMPAVGRCDLRGRWRGQETVTDSQQRERERE